MKKMCLGACTQRVHLNHSDAKVVSLGCCASIWLAIATFSCYHGMHASWPQFKLLETLTVRFRRLALEITKQDFE